MSNLVYLILAFFAGYRTIHMLQVDIGPFGIFEYPRTFLEYCVYQVSKIKTKKLEWLVYAVNNINDGYNCPVCLSVWIYAGLTALLSLTQPLTLFHFVAIWLGLSGIYLFTRKKGWL